jgi:hypothetical protein
MSLKDLFVVPRVPHNQQLVYSGAADVLSLAPKKAKDIGETTFDLFLVFCRNIFKINWNEMYRI